MPAFRPLSDVELARLSDEELIAQMVRAREAGDRAQARLVLQVLVFGYIDDLKRRAAPKLPAHAVEHVVAETFLSALCSSLDGTSVREFRGWLHTILDRRIADYYRASRVDTQPLPDGGGDDGRSGPEPSEPDETGAVAVRLAVDHVLERLRPVHRQVVELYVFGDLAAREVAARINDGPAEPLDAPVTENNVHKIAERFRRELRAELEGTDTS